MRKYDLPKLPDGCRYGAEITLPLPKGSFNAPEGHAIKCVDTLARTVVCVPIQQWIPATESWVTIK